MATVRRNTKQLSIILGAIKRMPRHFTAEDVYKEVKKENPSVGQATVFRNMNKMSEEGILLRIEVPGGASRYELIAPKHYHAKCMVCGKELLGRQLKYCSKSCYGKGRYRRGKMITAEMVSVIKKI